MMNTVAPVWDGNETWLVLGGAALFGAFPLAYSVVLSALYLPLILMLVGLIYMIFRPTPVVHSEDDPQLDRETLIKIGLCTVLLLIQERRRRRWCRSICGCEGRSLERGL